MDSPSLDPNTITAEHKDQKSYLAAFLLTAFLGLVGTNRMYTGHYLIGWIRCLLFIVSIVGPVLFMVNLAMGILGTTIALTAGGVAITWWYIDLWLYYLSAVKDHKTGESLVILGPKDKSYARSMMVSSHLLVVIIPLLLGIGTWYTVQQLKGSLPKTGINQTNLLNTNSTDQQLQQLGL